MDPYTRKTKTWLDSRFKKTSETGIYYAHQPIYGFRKDHFDPSYASRYIPTYQIMKSLSRFKFDSLLDVGGGEGYKAYIAKQLFGAKVENSDLSSEACKRAEEIFHIKSTSADIHELPFADNEFDVIICSETLEHVAEFNKAINEILRVAKKAVVITVPHEDQSIIDKNIREDEPHGHIHSFDLKSFDFLKSRGYDVMSKKILSKLLLFCTSFIEEPKKEYNQLKKWPKIIYDIYNLCMRLLSGTFGVKMMVFLIALDSFVCRFTSAYSGICCIILKDKSCYGKKSRKVSVARVMNCKVPYYYLNEY